MPELKTFYFTFGSGSPLADYTQVVKAPNESVARCGMFRYYHDKWCACYHGDDKDVVTVGANGLVEIGNIMYKPLAKVITAYDEDEIGCG